MKWLRRRLFEPAQVYFREEKVFDGLLGDFPSLDFIRNELSNIAWFVSDWFNNTDDRIDAAERRITVEEFPLPAVFLSNEEPLVQFYDLENPEDKYSTNKRKARMVDKRLGEYDYKKHLITLYVPNIEFGTNYDVDTLKARISMVLAHEFFHACQHFISPQKAARYKMAANHKGDCKPNDTCRVMEATADFFAYIWLKEQNGILRKQDEERTARVDRWIQHDFDYWPYAGAKYFLLNYRGEVITRKYEYDDSKSKEKFMWVLNGFAEEKTKIREVLKRILADPFKN